MKETNIIYDSVSNTWSIIVKVVNKSLLQIEYPELTGYKTKEDAEIAYHKACINLLWIWKILKA